MPKKKKTPLSCHICGSKYKKELVSLEIVEGSGHYEKTEALKCSKCGDVVFDTTQLEQLRMKVTRFKIRRKLGISGNALILRIPADIKEFYGLSEDNFVEITPLDKKKFIVEVS